MGAILIIESSTEICSVALSVDGVLIDHAESGEGHNHARLITVFAQELLLRNNISPDDLVAVAVSKGPGSYTGLRIGVSVAKGICYARQIPLIAIGTLEAMTRYVIGNRVNFDVPEDKPALFCPMIDARRMEVYSELFDEKGDVIKPISATIVDESFLSEELAHKNVVFFGNGSEKCRKVIRSSNAFFIGHLDASAKFMCNLVWETYNKKQFENVAYFEPFYLKDFIATVPKKNL